MDYSSRILHGYFARWVIAGYLLVNGGLSYSCSHSLMNWTRSGSELAGDEQSSCASAHRTQKPLQSVRSDSAHLQARRPPHGASSPQYTATEQHTVSACGTRYRQPPRRSCRAVAYAPIVRGSILHRVKVMKLVSTSVFLSLYGLTMYSNVNCLSLR